MARRIIIEERDDGQYSAAAKLRSASQLKAAASPLAGKILSLLAEGPSYPAALAKRLKVHEQKIYYHIRSLEKARLILVVKEEHVKGGVARHYSLAAPAYCLLLGELQRGAKLTQTHTDEEKYLSPFVVDGELDAIIVVGSPDPHGPEKARSRDGYYGTDLGLFLGRFLRHAPGISVKLDTEFGPEDWHRNLIVLGGPVTNKIAGEINKYLPIRFDASNNVHSKLSGRTYTADEIGVVEKITNPHDKNKKILSVAGRRYVGTRAAIVALLTAFQELVRPNLHDPKTYARVIEGIDKDSDGLVDAVEVLE